MPKLFIYGFPGQYAGASTELHHQIYVWKQIPGLEIAIIPTEQGWKNEPLLPEMRSLGIEVYDAHKFGAVKPEDAVINFCSSKFLENVSHIHQFTKRTIFVNCMTYIFDNKKDHTYDEIGMHQRHQIGFSLYQRPQVLEDHRSVLQGYGSTAEFLHFVPYFNPEHLDYSVKDQEFTQIGRISRDARDKYTPFNSHIYNGIVAPKLKRGHWLGFGSHGHSVTGDPPEWIKTYVNQQKLPVRDFYNLVDFIVQPTNTKHCTENWPRIGLESMYAGKPLVVDNHGGWQNMIEHGVTGFLCNHERDFMYWGTRLAYEPELREQIAINARNWAIENSCLAVSRASWERVFERVFN